MSLRRGNVSLSGLVRRYANALTVRDGVKRMVEGSPTPTRAAVFAMGAQDELDVTTSDALRSLLTELRAKDIDVYFADVHGPVLEHLRETGLLATVGEGHVLPTLDAAVREAESSATSS
jgi:MFS superfamily sulfate permease-like transporter